MQLLTLNHLDGVKGIDGEEVKCVKYPFSPSFVWRCM